jgi:hypothetical protein
MNDRNTQTGEAFLEKEGRLLSEIDPTLSDSIHGEVRYIH